MKKQKVVNSRWGMYQGYTIYRHFGNDVCEYSKEYNEVVFVGRETPVPFLWLNGVAIGKINQLGQIFEWYPEKAFKDQDNILDLAVKCSVRGLVGESLADYNIKYSE